jgi:hypothetical protein
MSEYSKKDVTRCIEESSYTNNKYLMREILNLFPNINEYGNNHTQIQNSSINQ